MVRSRIADGRVAVWIEVANHTRSSKEMIRAHGRITHESPGMWHESSPSPAPGRWPEVVMAPAVLQGVYDSSSSTIRASSSSIRHAAS
jgi:hypothetical protein